MADLCMPALPSPQLEGGAAVRRQEYPVQREQSLLLDKERVLVVEGQGDLDLNEDPLQPRTLTR